MAIDKRVLDVLKKVASKQFEDRKGLITPEELFEPFGDLFPPDSVLDTDLPHHRDILEGMLKEISAAEHKMGRPLISAVCVSRDHKPGKWFYDVGKNLGLLKPDASPLGEYAFYVKELDKVYRHWARRKMA